MHIKYVASNLKGGVSANLGEKTLIVGPNGSGKSSVVGAVELALTGRVSDIAGRDTMAKDTELIAQLAPGGKGELFARVVTDGNAEIRWVAGAKGSKKAQHHFPEGVFDPTTVFPLLPVTDAVKGNPLTARKFFLQYAVPNLTMEDVLKRIPATLHDNFRASTLKCGINDPAVDKLLMALEFSEQKARGAKSTAKAKAETAQSVAEGLEPLPTDAVIEGVKKEQKESRKALEALIQARAQAQQAQRVLEDGNHLRTQLATAQGNIETLKASLAQADAMLAQTPAPASFDPHTLNVMAIIAKVSTLEVETQAPQTCPVCKTPTQLGTFQQRHAAASAFKQQEEAKAGPYYQLKSQRDQIATNLAQWQTHAASIEAQLTGVQQVVAAGTGVNTVSDADYMAAQDRVTRADAEIQRIENLKSAWATAGRVKEVAKDATKEGSEWADLAEACADTVSRLLDAGVSDFCKKVQMYLPPTDNFALELRDGKKTVFRIGLRREGVVHTALSGAEWSRVMAAVACACIVPGKLAVVIPPDRSFDPHTLKLVLHAFSNVPGQVIIATTTLPEFVPQGWTVIDTAKGEHKTGTV